MVERYIYYLLHREQLHVSALDNGHLLYVINNIYIYHNGDDEPYEEVNSVTIQHRVL